MTDPHISFASLIADPELYIEEIFQLHPTAQRNKQSGKVSIHNDIIQSSFHYQLLEEGLFLFSFDSYSPIDAHYEFIPNPVAKYYSLVFYFTESSSKTPFYVKTPDGIFANDQISFFFNGDMTAEIFIKAKHKASGLRIDFHEQWMQKHIVPEKMLEASILSNVILKKKSGYSHTNCLQFESLVYAINAMMDNEETPFRMLQLKQLSTALTIQYFEDLMTGNHAINKKESSTLQEELKSALEIMQKNIYKKFPGTNILAESSNLSESNFNKKFKKTFHETAGNYFKKIKMKEALHQLQLGKRVKFVAHHHGYQNVASFGRAFKLVYGKSPAEYVKQP